MLDITPTQGFPHMYDFIGNTARKAANPIVLVVFSFVIMIYYVLFSYLGLGGGSSTAAPSSPGMTIIEVLMWGMFIFLVLINGIQYFFNVDIKASIRNLFSKVPEVDIAVISPPNAGSTEGGGDGEEGGGAIVEDDAGVPEILRYPQVFHIPDNVYTFNDAKAVCKAYGADLADYKQIEDSYQAGGEWCGFGWSKDQLALYPTQPQTWKGLQKIPGHKHDCGRPGINGGFIANPNVRFGANCYGYKPKMTPLERKMLDEDSPFPVTRRELQFQKRVDKFRNKLSDILVSPFNYERWSQV